MTIPLDLRAVEADALWECLLVAAVFTPEQSEIIGEIRGRSTQLLTALRETRAALPQMTVDEIRRRLVVYALTIDGYDSLNAGQQELYTTIATWVHQNFCESAATVLAKVRDDAS